MQKHWLQPNHGCNHVGGPQKCYAWVTLILIDTGWGEINIMISLNGENYQVYLKDIVRKDLSKGVIVL